MALCRSGRSQLDGRFNTHTPTYVFHLSLSLSLSRSLSFHFNQVGLQSCQEMIDCTGMIWKAGNAIEFPLTNLAVDGVAKQKCDYNAGSPAWNANDGQINGPVSHTGHGCTDQPWWSVDLGGIKEIHQVKIYNRLIQGECQKENCQDRLKNFYIRLYETDPEGSNPVVAAEHYQEDPIGNEFTINFDGFKARWVRIEVQYVAFLHLREVEVFGRNLHPNPYPFSLSSEQGISEANRIINTEWNADLALGKTAIASSTATAAKVNPYFAVDGKPDTYWRSGEDVGKFLFSVDLGKVHNLKKLRSAGFLIHVHRNFIYSSLNPKSRRFSRVYP